MQFIKMTSNYVHSIFPILALPLSSTDQGWVRNFVGWSSEVYLVDQHLLEEDGEEEKGELTLDKERKNEAFRCFNVPIIPLL